MGVVVLASFVCLSPFSISLPIYFVRHSTGAHALSAPVATPLFAPTHITSLGYNMTRTITSLVNMTMSLLQFMSWILVSFLSSAIQCTSQGYLLRPQYPHPV